MDQNELKSDWRLSRGQADYMTGATLLEKKYSGTDHDHCTFCWMTIHSAACVREAEARIGRSVDPATYVTEGYCTADERIWVCPRGSEDFHAYFGWKTDQET